SDFGVDLRSVARTMPKRTVSSTRAVATPHASASGSVTLGSVRSVGGFLPVTFVHAAASTLRSTIRPPVVANVVTIRVLEPPEPSLFLLIGCLLAPLRNCVIIPRIACHQR